MYLKEKDFSKIIEVLEDTDLNFGLENRPTDLYLKL